MGTRPQGDDRAPVEVARNLPKGVFRVCLLLYTLGVRTKSDARKEQVKSKDIDIFRIIVTDDAL